MKLLFSSLLGSLPLGKIYEEEETRNTQMVKAEILLFIKWTPQPSPFKGVSHSRPVKNALEMPLRANCLRADIVLGLCPALL